MSIKPRKIQRGLESRHARNQTGNAPLLGRVVRMRHPEHNIANRWMRRGQGRPSASPAILAARRRVILIWSVMLIITTVGVIGGFMMFWLRLHANQTDGHDARQAAANVRIVSKFVSPGEDDALDLVKRACAIEDAAEVAACFHLGTSSAAEVVAFNAGSVARDGRIVSSVWLSSMDVEGLLMEGVLVGYAGHKDSPTERLAFLTPDDKGVWKMDFDAFARVSRPSWQDLLERRVDRAQVRVFVAKDAYFNGPFLDETQWLCFGMVSPESKELLPDGQELLRGYCRTGSPQAKATVQIFERGEGTHRVTLELHRPDDADSRQFEISRVLSEDWVLTPKPFDEKFK